MFIHWNAFYFIRETNYFPHARTLRTTLGQKLADTFKVLSGFRPKQLLSLDAWIGSFSREHDAGLLDYTTLYPLFVWLVA